MPNTLVNYLSKANSYLNQGAASLAEYEDLLDQYGEMIGPPGMSSGDWKKLALYAAIGIGAYLIIKKL
jgi:hypothetical protein